MGCVLGKGEGDGEGEGEAYAPPSPPLEPPAPRLKTRLGEGDSIYLALGQSTGPGAHAASPSPTPSPSATSPASSPASSTAAASSAPPPARARAPAKCVPTSSICNTYFSTPCSSATFTSLTSSAVSSAATSADPSEAECVRWPSRVCTEHGNPCVALSRRCHPCKRWRGRGRGRGKPRKGECRGVCKYYPPGRDIIYHPQAAPCFAQARYAQYRCLDWMRGCIRCVNGQMMTCVNNMAPGGQLSCVCRPCCPGAFGCSDFGCRAPGPCHRC